MIQVTKRDSTETNNPRAGEPRSPASNVVQLPALRFSKEAARLRLAASHRDECADCIQMALTCLFSLAVMLSASALLRQASIGNETAHYLRESFGCLAAASGFAAVLALCLALVHFIRFRQV